MPAGTRQQETLRVLEQLKQKIPELNNEFKQNRKDGKDIALSVSKTVENSPFRLNHRTITRWRNP